MKFVVLTSQRSGSVFLQKALSSHYDCHCFGELILGMGGFNDPKVPNWMRKRRRLRLGYSSVVSGAAVAPRRVVRLATDSRTESAVGFRVMHQHVTKGLHAYLKSGQASVILLSRQDVLRQAVSRFHMHERQRSIGFGSAHSTVGAFDDSFVVEPQKLLSEMKRLQRADEGSRRKYSDVRHLNLTYENLIDGGSVRTEVGEQICNFLGIDTRVLSSPVAKTGGRPLGEVVKNWDDVYAALSNTRFEEYLDGHE